MHKNTQQKEPNGSLVVVQPVALGGCGQGFEAFIFIS